jgi:hypothetical protein
MEVGKVYKYTVSGNDKVIQLSLSLSISLSLSPFLPCISHSSLLSLQHPFHLHVNSFQLEGVTDTSGYFVEGDWHDVLYTPTGVSIDSYNIGVDTFHSKL